MSGNPWSKFFWQDWESDQALKLCSLAAQGLWMRMLCIAAAHDPVGYVSVGGKPLDETGLARLTGVSESEVAILLQELDQHGVFSTDRHGRIYSRRLIRDAKKHAIAKKNGKKGGNPSLGNNKGNSGQDNRQDKPRDKPHKPEARSQSILLDKSNSPDPSKTLFDTGVAALTSQGVAESSARSFLASCQKSHGDAAALDALNRSIGKTDVRSHMKAILGNSRAQREYFGV